MKSLAFVLLIVCIVGSVTSKSLESKSLLDSILGHHGGCFGPLVDCFADPCMMSTCSNTNAMKCVAPRSGHIKKSPIMQGVPTIDAPTIMQWVTAGSVTAKSLESKSLLDTILGHHGCQGGVGLVNCFVDPCMVARCSNTAAVHCVSNYCGGCHADWEDVNGMEGMGPLPLPMEVEPRF
ncbi:hypothetical protein KP79_PYT20221 [Mizuhopecten yessoensis]|uniref:Uncharacterized protein n=1 Tax=Mizuhopecten yessoensis TaxID=6573 RepID=A0A210PWJ9_MIZYE|nr:hypothetical protein KP79_PYT20221 [Mizuhopecten yessoensis]